MSGDHHHHHTDSRHSFDPVASTLTEAMASSPAFFDQINPTAFDRTHSSFDRLATSSSLSPSSLLSPLHQQQHHQQQQYNQHIQHQHHLHHPLYNQTTSLLQHLPSPQQLLLQQQPIDPAMLVAAIGHHSSSSSSTSSKHARPIDDTVLSEENRSSIDPSDSRQYKRSRYNKPHNSSAATATSATPTQVISAQPCVDQLTPATTTVASDKITPPISQAAPGLLPTTTTAATVPPPQLDQPTPSLTSTPSSSSSSSTSSLQQQLTTLSGTGVKESQVQPTPTIAPEATRPLCFGMIQSLVVTLYPRHLEFEEGKSDPVLIRRATTANKASLAVEHEAGLYGYVVSELTDILIPLVDANMVWWEAHVPRQRRHNCACQHHSLRTTGASDDGSKGASREGQAGGPNRV
ncbi:MAG: hypothetical protein J3R72DRAFT_130874 [Linnemannia gamsii]|nr:MAG: hypothetical protein J3R72DRAFT_130874 [Linnemannia gamsii]